MWSAVTCKYYDVLHTMEEERLIDLSDEMHLFCVHYVFLPHLKSDLKCFLGSWNNHPIRTEGNLSPEQLWHIGMLQTPVTEPDVEVHLNLFAISNGCLFPQEQTDPKVGLLTLVCFSEQYCSNLL